MANPNTETDINRTRPLFTGYRTLDGTHDEFFAPDGEVRPGLEDMVAALDHLGRDEFRARMKLAEATFLRGGITFSVYDDERGSERVFPFDLIPRAIGADEWEGLERGLTIKQEFEYTPGATTLQTTPYEVLESQRGVCQDFANLFIALARLLRVPSRYRVGYVYTGGDYENREQGDASHAWVECYLPWLGWRGFDPTNGRSVDLEHVRVACGRDYRDATPTSGTIAGGGGREILETRVEVREIAPVEAAG